MTETRGAAPHSASSLLDELVTAAFAVDRAGSLIYANPAAVTLFGDRPEAQPGADVRRGLFAASMGGAIDEVLTIVATSGTWVGELSMVRADGAAAPMATAWTAVADQEGPGSAGALVLVEDPGAPGSQPVPAVPGEVFEGESAAQQRPQSRRLHRFSSVLSELLVAESVDSVAKVVTEHLADAAGATVGSISLLVDDQTLALVGIRGGREGVASRWATYSLDSNTPAAETVRNREPLVLVGRDEIRRRYPDLEAAAEGERSILCLPLLANTGRPLGVITLSFPGRWHGDEAESLFLGLLADTCAMTIDRLHAQSEARDREAKLRFLAETSAEFVTELDYEATLVAAAEAAVPWFADWCSIALEEDGQLRTLSVAHADPAMLAFVEELQTRYPPEPDPDQGAYKVLRTGVSELWPEVPPELIEAAAKDEEHLRLLRQLDLRSGLVCPLKVRDRVLGVITWAASGSDGRRFTHADQVFGEDLARRAAVAIDNAQMHSQMRDVALELQRAVLPAELPAPEGWTTAVSYLPAGRTDAGGDFYDVVPLEDGRVAAFVGDVMGRGVQAASVMAQMRAAIRTLVAVDPAPAAVLTGMDRVFDTLHLDQLVTMVYALADPSLDSVAVINAGHPEPFLVRTGGAERLISSGTLLLGAGGGHRSVLTVDLGPGDALLLYTDGLVERRREDHDEVLERLLASRPLCGTGIAEEWLDGLVEDVRDPTRDDDVAALLLIRDT